MESGWRERRLYPLLGIISVLSLLYLNFGDHLSFPIPLWGQPEMSFVGTNSTRFVLLLNKEEQSTVYINGWNSYWLMEASVWVGPSRSRVSEMLKRGAQMGMTVCRTWAFSDGDGPNALQISPGVFNERVFRGLDYVIVEARRHRIRLILSLVNNLNAFGGKAQYVRWAQEAGVNVSAMKDPFFLHPLIKDYYKAYVKAILTRKNSLSGVKYSEEPAIFAWELMNEPRCESSSSAPALQVTDKLKFPSWVLAFRLRIEKDWGGKRRKGVPCLLEDFLNEKSIHFYEFYFLIYKIVLRRLEI